MLAEVSLQERIFAFCYLLMAYILAVVFISSMTSAMTRRVALCTGFIQLEASHAPAACRKMSQVVSHHRDTGRTPARAEVVSH